MTDKEARCFLGGRSGSGAGSKYPWWQWTDGNWWKIERGEDFSQEADSMRRTLALHAQRHSMTVEIHKRGDVVLFRFADNG